MHICSHELAKFHVYVFATLENLLNKTLIYCASRCTFSHVLYILITPGSKGPVALKIVR